MNDPAGLWGLAVGLGTIALGLAIAYASARRARMRALADEAAGRAPAYGRWGRIAVAALVGLGVLIVCYWLLRATPGVAG